MPIKSDTTQRVLDPDVWDALEFSALVFGGIGAVNLYEGDLYPDSEWTGTAPYCAYGHALFLDPGAKGHPVADALASADIHTYENDEAVERINKRRRKKRVYDRVPFEAWAKELNLVRGE